MQKRTREILALALLLVLAVVGVGAMAWYILVGHNWNVAASNIDDSIGQMDGYTVVLCEGADPATDVDEIASDYRDKGAGVLVVRQADIARHREPFIVNRGGRRLGILSIDNAELRSKARSDITCLYRGGADLVIALSNDLTLGRLSAEGVVGGLSVIVFDDPEGLAPDGDYCGSSYCVRSPESGYVVAVIVSPSGVYTSKAIDGREDVEKPSG